MKIKLERKKSHTAYKNKAGKRLPSVTTILGTLAKPALIKWAWNMGKDGIDLDKARDEVFSIGTIAHFLCECHARKVEPDVSEFVPSDVSRAETCFIKFIDWWDKNGFKLLHSEVPLVSEAHQFGGTMDLIAEDREGRVWLIDLKTSKSIWPENLYQVAAYKQLVIENNLLQGREINNLTIVRIGKEDVGDFETRSYHDLTPEWSVFLSALNLYRAIQNCKRE